jgi:hypothetical protein
MAAVRDNTLIILDNKTVADLSTLK